MRQYAVALDGVNEKAANVGAGAHHPRFVQRALRLLLSLAGLSWAQSEHVSQRGGDVVRMGWQHIKSDNIAVRQEKTDKPLMIPIEAQLARALGALPRSNMTFPGGQILASRLPLQASAIGSAHAVTKRACRNVPRTDCASSRRRGSLTRAATPTRSKPSPGTSRSRKSSATHAPLIAPMLSAEQEPRNKKRPEIVQPVDPVGQIFMVATRLDSNQRRPSA
jgi:hypothetical protein